MKILKCIVKIELRAKGQPDLIVSHSVSPSYESRTVKDAKRKAISIMKEHFPKVHWLPWKNLGHQVQNEKRFIHRLHKTSEGTPVTFDNYDIVYPAYVDVTLYYIEK